MKKRILHIIPTLDRMGTAKQMSLLVRGLPREEFDVHVCVLNGSRFEISDFRFEISDSRVPTAPPSPGRQSQICNLKSEISLAAAAVPVTVIGSRWPIDPLAFWRLRRLVARLKPALIHTWLSAANICGYAVAKTCGVERLVAFLGGGEQYAVGVLPGKGGQWAVGSRQWAVERRVARRASQVVANCSGVRDLCIHHGLPAEKILVIPSAVETAGKSIEIPGAVPPEVRRIGNPSCEPSGVTRRELLAELGLPEGSRLIGLAGPLKLRNRIKDAIWAADLLKVIRDDVHLLIIGDGPHRDRLHRFRDQVRIRDRVHFLGDGVPFLGTPSSGNTDVLPYCRGGAWSVPRLLPHCDVFWSTSSVPIFWEEGQSNSLMEAMAAGVPVVATDVPGTRDLIVHETTGYLVPAKNRAALARYTQKLLDDADLAGRLGRAGRARMQRQFSVDKMVADYVELYRSLLD